VNHASKGTKTSRREHEYDGEGVGVGGKDVKINEIQIQNILYQNA